MLNFGWLGTGGLAIAQATKLKGLMTMERIRSAILEADDFFSE